MVFPSIFSIEEYNQADWLEFITAHPDSHFFHHPAWLTFLSNCYGYRPSLGLVRDRDGKIAAGLPFMAIPVFPGRKKWVSLPFSDHCQPLADSEDDLRILVQGLVSESNRQRAASLELRWDVPSPDFFRSSGHVLTTTRLQPNPAEVRARIKGNDFRKVSLGAKREIVCERRSSMEAMRIYYRLHLETRRRLGVPSQPWRFFQLLSEQIIQPGMGFISLAHQNGEYLAGIVFLRWKETLIYKFAASSMRGRQLAAAYPITWNAIEWGCKNGFETLDWGRSDSADQGLRDFKKRWASEEKPLIYSNNSQIVGSLASRLHPVFNQFISRSPIWVCRLSGELLYRFFG